jgi:predicted nucleotidyltransferase
VPSFFLQVRRGRKTFCQPTETSIGKFSLDSETFAGGEQYNLAMKNAQKYLEEIKSRLEEIEPYKIILFGSVAMGNSDEESDIDLIVVLDSEKISQNYEEKMYNKMLVRKAIRDISAEIPIDLLVYTKKEFEIIMNNKNSFFKEIELQGKVLYEKAG